MATWLSPYLPWLAAFLVLLLAAIFIAPIIVLRRARRDAAVKAETTANQEPERALRQAQQSLRAGLKRLAGAEAVPDHPYTVPWIALIGPPEAGIAGLHQAVDPAAPGDPSAHTPIGPHL